MENIIDSQDIASVRLNYASVGRRFVAMLIDGFVIMILTSILSALMMSYIAENPALFAGYFVLVLLILWLYEAILTSSSNQGTLGKMAMGIVVTNGTGERLSFVHSTGRYFSKFISSLLGIGYIIAFFTERNRALHDMMASTVVLRR
jgi:uncharacterized RDD family membrane protein YckC